MLEVSKVSVLRLNIKLFVFVKLVAIIVFLVGFVSCKSVYFNENLSTRDATKLYHNILKTTPENWKLSYSSDSNYVICIEGSDNIHANEPVSFYILDLANMSKKYLSWKKYHNVSWYSCNKVKLIKYMGLPPGSAEINNKERKNKQIYIYDIVTGEVYIETGTSK